MDVNVWNRLQILEKQFTAHKASVKQRTGLEIDLGADVADRLDVLEFNVSRLLLMVQTLGQICRNKNIFSEEEFDALMQAVDLSDGQADGGLNPDSVPGMQRTPESRSFLSFLRQAEKAAPDVPEDPGGFLAQLERAEEP